MRARLSLFWLIRLAGATPCAHLRLRTVRTEHHARWDLEALHAQWYQRG